MRATRCARNTWTLWRRRKPDGLGPFLGFAVAGVLLAAAPIRLRRHLLGRDAACLDGIAHLDHLLHFAIDIDVARARGQRAGACGLDEQRVVAERPLAAVQPMYGMLAAERVS